MADFANPQEDTYALRIILASATSSLPAMVFANDVTHGLYWDVNGLHLTGLSATPTDSTEAASKAYVDASVGGIVYPLTAPDGLQAAPSYSFSSDPTTGTWFDTFGNYVISVGGQYGIGIRPTLTTDIYGLLNARATPSLTVADGDTNTPSITFDGNTRLGFYREPITDTVGVSSPSKFAFPNDREVFFGALDNSDFMFISNAGTTLDIKANNISALEIDKNNTAGETKLLLWDITAATLQRVSIGAADSGGTGFRVLRIPN